MRAAMGIPGFRTLFLGLAASMAGDSLMLLVFGIWVKKLTGSSSEAGLVMLFVAIPAIMTSFGGWLIDRFRRRAFLATANAASVLALLPLLAVRDRSDVPLIFLSAALYGLAMQVTTAALNGLLQLMLPADLLAEANGALQTVREGLRLLGPLAGAALFAAFGGAMVAAIDGVSFLVAAGAIFSIPLLEKRPERAAGERLAELTAGVRHLWSDMALRRVTVAGAGAMLVLGMIESVSFVVIDRGLHRPPEFMGVFSSAQGVGAIGGGLAAARLIRAEGEMAAIAVGFAGFGLGCAACMMSSIPAVLGGIAVAGAGLAISVVGMATVIQRRTPPALISRASLGFEALQTLPQALSIGVGAALVAVVDYRLLLAVIAAGTVASAVSLWLRRKLTRPGRHEVPERSTETFQRTRGQPR